MKVIIDKHILRDLQTMKNVGTIWIEQGKEAIAPVGTFISKRVESITDSRPDPIIEV